MKFYPVTVDGVPQLARTKDEAKQHGPIAEPIEIDVSQGPLMAHLNDLMRRAHDAEAQRSGQENPCPEKTADPEDDSSTAMRVMSELDAGPKIKIDDVVEIIMNAKGYALGRLARAVAIAFGKLGESR